MDKRNFRELAERQWARGNFVCGGIDTDYEKIPPCIKEAFPDAYEARINFSCRVIDVISEAVGAYKLNSAFYESFGGSGIIALRNIAAYIKKMQPEKPVILDFKRADIGNTNIGYAALAFDYIGADAVTVNPYFGKEALEPFLERSDKGILVLCRTSNKGADEFQDLITLPMHPGGKPPHITDAEWLTTLARNAKPLYERVAERVAESWNKNWNCGLVAGATASEELKRVRRAGGDQVPILIPGAGAQGGNIESAVRAGMDSRGKGFFVNSSRGIMFASGGGDYALAAWRAAHELRVKINRARENSEKETP